MVQEGGEKKKKRGRQSGSEYAVLQDSPHNFGI